MITINHQNLDIDLQRYGLDLHCQASKDAMTQIKRLMLLITNLKS
jgi:hypothetical protein